MAKRATVRALLVTASVALAACDGKTDEPGPASTASAAPSPAPSASASPAPSPTPSPRASVSATPSPAPTRSAGAGPPRTLSAILLELEELEHTGVTFDPDVDARLTERPDDLLDEAAELGARRLKPALEALQQAQSLPPAHGTRKRRTFVCRLVGRLAHHDPAAVSAKLDGILASDVLAIARAVPEAHRDVVGSWFLSRSRLAKNTSGGAGKPEVRLALLEGYASGRTLPVSDPTLRAARADPDARVQALTRKLGKRD